MLKQIAFGLAVGAVAYSLDALLRRKCSCRCACAAGAGSAARRQYKVVDLSYSQDPRQHLKDVRAYHELDGWHLLSVVHLPSTCRWLYYLERDAEPGAQGGVASAAVGEEQGLPGPVRRVGGDPRAREEHLARRLEGQLDLPRRRGSFPGEEK